ncbi:MAG TPA: malto-oligosyltrehalose synthase [Burkholderiales bacterium]|nr:malto-oligosyltrehalose synthase [Burkholderiales bacterium]
MEIAESYVDVWGETRPVEPEVRAALEKALGRPVSRKRLSVKKQRCYQPPALEHGRIWGFTVQLYGLRSRRNWGIGDFGDLRTLVDLATDLGAGFVGVNPLHATSGASPYSPSSRHALNALYVDVDALPEFSPAIRKPAGDGPLVDYAKVRKAKYAAFEKLFARMKDRAGLERFRRETSYGVRTYALYEALREKFGGGWQGWPQGYRRPGSAQVKAFAKKHAKRVDFHLWLQWRAREQLDAVQRRALERGMPVGLYVDLALGSDGGGAEVWCDQEAFAAQMSIGAPPDEFNPKGQDWGLPPYSPRALAAAGYRPFIELLRANMPQGGALRMDHVMSLMRLWWIPRGNKPERGGYVHYPFEDLLAILAAQSRERECLVIGEDLGTVLPEFRAALNEAGVLSYRPLFFEKTGEGAFAPPRAYPREALVCVTTHDLPTWKGYFSQHDLKLREQLGFSVDASRESQSRRDDGQKLIEALQREGLDGSALSAHRFIARTPAKLMAVQPEDVFEVQEQANLPGTVAEHPNWQRRLPVPLEDWAGHPQVHALARALKPLRGAGKRVPLATYRLQLNKDFRFADAIAIVPYLASLGVTHLYASPFLMARPGSMHGYDVTDHNRINPEIGTEAELLELIATLHRHGLGLVMDIVPNHMGVLQGENPWWLDVLEKGRASRYCRFFDIDWAPAKAELRGKVLLPVLGDHYGAVLERGELKVVKEKGRFWVKYFDHRLPLSPRTTQKLDLRKVNKDPLALHRLLERQNYRVAFWRVASDEINYRRFFEITDLAALRQEERAVFDATHQLVAKLCRLPGVDGLRVDHPDGLADPQAYFEHLARACGAAGGPPWVVVEKILADHEALCSDWAVAGTTGYRYANVLTGVFIDREAGSRFDRIYQRFTGERRSFEEIAHESRMLIMGTTLAAELSTAATRLARIAAGNRFTRDYTVSGLWKALAEVAASFPVYRTYVTARGASETDRRHIDWAIGRARRASRIADPSVFDFIRSVLLLEVQTTSASRRRQILDFVTRFQQVTAPVVAKGVEDTAFYRYHRLVALNEVGNEPGHFGLSLKAFHAASEDRAKNWPHTMLASSTHDTKRSEDVRARLGVLSELSSAWRIMLRRWGTMNRGARSEVNGLRAPSASDEYLFYQSALGIWPLAAPDLKDLRSRLQAYMLKAVREAKQRTSWINPDEEYEAALARFIDQSLDNPVFVKDVGEGARRIGRLGLLVGLSQALLKVASPGVPDYYQGTEVWDFSLVDPDNRRPVDYEYRRSLLENGSLDLESGAAKLHVIRQGLRLRRELPELFFEPAYTPLHADGAREENVVAFMLSLHNQRVVAVAPRLFARLMEEGDEAPIGARIWGESRLPIPPGNYENVLLGEPLNVGEGGMRLAELLERFPVALLKARP